MAPRERQAGVLKLHQVDTVSDILYKIQILRRVSEVKSSSSTADLKMVRTKHGLASSISGCNQIERVLVVVILVDFSSASTAVVLWEVVCSAESPAT